MTMMFAISEWNKDIIDNKKKPLNTISSKLRPNKDKKKKKKDRDQDKLMKFISRNKD